MQIVKLQLYLCTDKLEPWKTRGRNSFEKSHSGIGNNLGIWEVALEASGLSKVAEIPSLPKLEGCQGIYFRAILNLSQIHFICDCLIASLKHSI